jgi:hypothetical protein
VDEDCDDVIDDDAPGSPTWYADADGDGHGDHDVTTEACAAPAGFVGSDDDCEDGDATIHPGADDRAGDGIDQDCDGVDAWPSATERPWGAIVDTDAAERPPAGCACGTRSAPPSPLTLLILFSCSRRCWRRR